MVVVLILLSFAIFIIARLCPGDPLRSYYGDGLEHMSEAQRRMRGKTSGLNDSLPFSTAAG